jgi:hypothetical protein
MKTRTILSLSFFSLIICFCVPFVGNASTIIQTFDFAASGFTYFAGPGSDQTVPIDPVTGKVTITYDDAVAVTDSTSGIVLNNLSLTTYSSDYGSICFTYYTGPVKVLNIGGLPDGAGSINGYNSDWMLVVNNPSLLDPSWSVLYSYPYSDRSGNTYAYDYLPGTGSLTITTETAPAVPIPPTMFLLLPGLLGLVGLKRRFRK